jgi:hypothetical protein
MIILASQLNESQYRGGSEQIDPDSTWKALIALTENGTDTVIMLLPLKFQAMAQPCNQIYCSSLQKCEILSVLQVYSIGQATVSATNREELPQSPGQSQIDDVEGVRSIPQNPLNWLRNQQLNSRFKQILRPEITDLSR